MGTPTPLGVMGRQKNDCDKLRSWRSRRKGKPTTWDCVQKRETGREVQVSLRVIHTSSQRVGRKTMGFPRGSDAKESACDVGNLGSIPELGRSLEDGMATLSSILTWTEPGGLQSIGSQKIERD